MIYWRNIFFGFCIYANIFLAAFGILIKDTGMIILAVISLLLLSVAFIQNYHVKENKKEKEKPDDKGSLS